MTAREVAESQAVVMAMARRDAAMLDLALMRTNREGVFCERLERASREVHFTRVLHATLRTFPLGKLPFDTESDWGSMTTERRRNREALNTFVLLKRLLCCTTESALEGIEQQVHSAVADRDADFFRLLGGLIGAKPRHKPGAAKTGLAHFIRRMILPMELYREKTAAASRQSVIEAAHLLGQDVPRNLLELSKAINSELRTFRAHLAKATWINLVECDWPLLMECFQTETAK